ncbi:hypothetical protein [Nannocystis exedens]|nr:hypothetical protein [Nannocystis exedens]
MSLHSGDGAWLDDEPSVAGASDSCAGGDATTGAARRWSTR